MYAVPNMAVFCSSLMLYYAGLILLLLLLPQSVNNEFTARSCHSVNKVYYADGVNTW